MMLLILDQPCWQGSPGGKGDHTTPQGFLGKEQHIRFSLRSKFQGLKVKWKVNKKKENNYSSLTLNVQK